MSLTETKRRQVAKRSDLAQMSPSSVSARKCRQWPDNDRQERSDFRLAERKCVANCELNASQVAKSEAIFFVNRAQCHIEQPSRQEQKRFSVSQT
ncbi:hypothetical protein AVEN_89389-1 [Araneus ventricosus]|uniref:Uncharacterized protein n=1 Tax=Araneus ventricosus TaxID=182803 RepID=A0A4Y2WUN5_ARAVE|nr:hypothetical protein AVEN_89389-1 [Araneus ventricosus]